MPGTWGVFLQNRDSIDALLMEASECCWNLGCQLMNEAAAALRFGAIAEEVEDPFA